MTIVDRRTALRGIMGGAVAATGLSLGGGIAQAATAGRAAATASKGWLLEGITAENCTCNAFCVLNLGPFKLKGWHRSACIWDIRGGHSNGVDLSGTRAALAYELPDEATAAKAASRVYIDPSANAAQRRELEAILSGRRGGVFGTFNHASSNNLPVMMTPISLVDGEAPIAIVGDVARVTLRRLKTSSGKQTVLQGAAYPEAFGVAAEDLCDATGSAWNDPGMTPWRSGGGSGIARFRLTG